MVAAENDPDERISAGERYAEIYEINLARCIFCGYCEVACPFDAITMGHEYELADYNREDLIFTKEMLLAEPGRAHPSAPGGRMSEHGRPRTVAAPAADDGASRNEEAASNGAGRLLRRGDRRRRRGHRRGRAAEPFYSVLALVVHLVALAGLFLLLYAQFVAAAQVVVYAGAVMVLYVFVAAYVGARRGADLGADPRPAIPRPAARRGALRRALDRDPGHRAVVARQRGADGAARLRLPGGDRQPAPGALPDRLRGGLDAAAGRRRRARSSLAAKARPPAELEAEHAAGGVR